LFIILLLVSWLVGGWSIATHAFRLHPRERLATGLAAGFLLYIVVVNGLAYVLGFQRAAWGAVFLLLMVGVVFAWRSSRPPLRLADLRQWGPLAAVLAITAVLWLIQRGLTIFDDYLNLPLVSTLAAGDFPPGFPFDAGQRIGYHYGLHLIAAALVRAGGLFPWAAWDGVRAFAIALTLVTAWLWYRRISMSRALALLGALLIAFGGGIRWALLFLPRTLLVRWSGGLSLPDSAIRVAPSLSAALSTPWQVDERMPMAIPFAFANGILNVGTFSWRGGESAILLTVFVLLLLSSRRMTLAGMALFTLLFASLALTAEHAFGLIGLGLALVFLGLTVFKGLRRPRGSDLKLILGFLAASALIALSQGGVLTEAATGLLMPGASGAAYGFAGLSLSPIPAVMSGHLGRLSLLNPGQAAIALAELGLPILLLPLVAVLSWRWFRRGHWFYAGLGFAGVLAFVVGLFLRYGVARDVDRVFGFALQVCLVLPIPAVWHYFRNRAGGVMRAAIAAGYFASLLGGIVIFGIQMLAITTPTSTDFLEPTDVRMARQYWNALSPAGPVLDVEPYRAPLVFGVPTRSLQALYEPLPTWKNLVDDPDPVRAAGAGYDYIYMSGEWWAGLSAEQRSRLDLPCAETLSQIHEKSSHSSRWLVDIRSCR
jgi:hypothetical protein